MWLLFNCRRVYVVRLGRQQAASCNSVDSFFTTKTFVGPKNVIVIQEFQRKTFLPFNFQVTSRRSQHVRRRHSGESQGLGPRNRSLYPSPSVVSHGLRNPTLLQAFNSCSIRAGGYGQSTYHCLGLVYLLQKI